MLETPINDLNIVFQCLPQRPPIVLVDALLDYTEDRILVGYRVPKNGLFVADQHFAEPGIIEHMAQSVALHTGYTYFLKKEASPVGYIGSINNLVIERLVLEEETIVTQVDIVQEFAGVTLVNIISKIDQEIIASGTMKTIIAR